MISSRSLLYEWKDPRFAESLAEVPTRPLVVQKPHGCSKHISCGPKTHFSTLLFSKLELDKLKAIQNSSRCHKKASRGPGSLLVVPGRLASQMDKSDFTQHDATLQKSELTYRCGAMHHFELTHTYSSKLPVPGGRSYNCSYVLNCTNCVRTSNPANLRPKT